MTQKRIAFLVSLFLSCFLIHQIIFNLGFLKDTVTPELYLNRAALCLFGFFISIIGGWWSLGFGGGLFFSMIAATLVFFVAHIAHTQIYLWFLLEYALLGLVLYRNDENFSEKISLAAAEREKSQIEKNDLAASYKSKGEAISMLFEKYSTYYNMRKLAEELAGTLRVSEICQIVVNRCVDFILRGDVALVLLSEAESSKLPVIAFKEYGASHIKANRRTPYEADIFDQWAVKNRKQLISLDTHQDFRFDAKDAVRYEQLRSLILVPLIQGNRVLGTLRINSSRPNTFMNDDLRLLDTIAVLASSALSNAILFEQTQELAIKDSLTGLFVRRHFFERFKEEHRRALINKKPLSLLMCDLDHFKQCNDRYGHGVGDLVLIHFSKILSSVSESAIVSRYGGEEFSVLLPEISLEEAFKIAEQIRSRLEENPLVIRREKILMTVSIGVSNLPEHTHDLETMVDTADKALYQAKKNGRNRVC